MGVICGIITPTKRDKATEIGHKIVEKLHIYNFDHVGYTTNEGVYLGCGLIYNTPESKLEQMPRKSRNNRYILTADAIIDNRTELFELFGMDKKLMSTTTDSELILLAYEKWGYSCPKYLIGDYAFAIWDQEVQELYCARDVMGSRTLYYTMDSDVFAFSTIEKPLLGIMGKKAEINERWLAGYLAIDSIQHNIDVVETIYRDIFQVLPANYVIFNKEGIKQTQYWDILKDTKPVRFKTDEEYVEAFNNIFNEAVASRLRSAGEVAIMLSGGMDSGSVACVAAKQLEKKNSKLYAFSSIPIKDFDQKSNTYTIYNESNEVKLVAEAYSNIDVSYCSFEGTNALTNMDQLIEILGQPYKTFQNMTWYVPVLQEAVKKHCSIMLNGQFGNNTISYGDFNVQLLTLYRNGKLIRAAKEVYAISKVMNLPTKKAYKIAAKVIIPYKLRNWRDKRRSKDIDRYKDVLVNPSLVRKWGIDKLLDDIGANMLTPKFYDYEETREKRIGTLALTHIANMETKLSLMNKITIRDACRDRRIVEFCLSIPPDQYVKNGHDRYLLRRAMKGILPDSIRTNVKTKGLQSADWILRLKPVWNKLVEEMDVILASEEIRRYIDINKVQELRNRMDSCLEDNDETSVRLIVILIILHRFILSFNQSLSNEVFA